MSFARKRGSSFTPTSNTTTTTTYRSPPSSSSYSSTAHSPFYKAPPRRRMLRSSRDEDSEALMSNDSDDHHRHDHRSSSNGSEMDPADDDGEDKIHKLKTRAIAFANTINKDHLKTFGLIAIICFLLLRLGANTGPPPETRYATAKSSKQLRNSNSAAHHPGSNNRRDDHGGMHKKKKYRNEENEGDDRSSNNSNNNDDNNNNDDDKPRKKKPLSDSYIPPSLMIPQPNNKVMQVGGSVSNPYQVQQPPPPPQLFLQGGLMQQQQFLPQLGNSLTLQQQPLSQQFVPQQGLSMGQQQQQQQQFMPGQNSALQQQEQQIQQQLALLKQQQELLAALQAQNPLVAGQTAAALPNLAAAALPVPEIAAPFQVGAAVMDLAAAAGAPPPVDPNRPTEADMAKLEDAIKLTELSNFAESWLPFDSKMVPIFWHIPKAGGSSVKDAIGSCHRHIMATEFGVTDGHGADTEIAIVYPKAPGGAVGDRSPFVNVDTTTVAGIARAKQMGFADSGLAQCVVTPFLWEANELFTQTAKGRLFAVFRHPVDRAISMFFYIQIADWEPSYAPELQSWTLEQYAKSEKIENNWMTRQLANQLSGDLTDDHLKIAMEVIRRKFLVGTMSKLQESMTRFEQFFQWKFHVNPPNQEACRKRLTGGGSNSNAKNKKELPKPGEPLWELLAASNLYDIQVYDYIEELFKEQAAFVQGIPENFREIDATCCKCDPPTYPPEGFDCPKQIPN